MGRRTPMHRENAGAGTKPVSPMPIRVATEDTESALYRR
jgi:hypothetical protein